MWRKERPASDLGGLFLVSGTDPAPIIGRALTGLSLRFGWLMVRAWVCLLPIFTVSDHLPLFSDHLPPFAGTNHGSSCEMAERTNRCGYLITSVDKSR